MSHSQLKINNQAIALVLFILINLTSCNCGNNDNQDPPSPETSSDTNTGGTNTGGTNTGGTNTGGTNTGGTNTGGTNTGGTNTGQTNTGQTNTGQTNTGQTNTGQTNTGQTNTGQTNTGQANTGQANTATIPITTQEIDQLLQELNNGRNPADPAERVHLKKFLKKVKANDTISPLYQEKILLSAIKYNNIPGYNTIDILKLAIDKSKDIINTPYKDLTFLQYAVYYRNTDAIDLLLQHGAQKDSKTAVDLTLAGEDIPAGSTAYDIAVILNRPGAINRLKP